MLEGALGNDVVTADDDNIPVLRATSFRNEDFVFDTQIVMEEVAAAIRRLKCRKALVLNCILDLETILQTFKHSIIVPVHKEKGLDPLSCGSYCGISQVSALAIR